MSLNPRFEKPQNVEGRKKSKEKMPLKECTLRDFQ